MCQDHVCGKEVKEKLTKLEGRVRRDVRHFPLAVGHGSRNGQLTLSTSFHADDTDIPAWAKSKFRRNAPMNQYTHP
jgi:hypothetical protein